MLHIIEFIVPLLLLLFFYWFFFPRFFLFNLFLNLIVFVLRDKKKVFIFYSKILIYTTLKFYLKDLHLYIFDKLDILNSKGMIDTGLYIINQEIDIPRKKKGNKVYTETTFINSLAINYFTLYLAIFFEVKNKLLKNNKFISYITLATINDGNTYTMHKVFTMNHNTKIYT